MMNLYWIWRSSPSSSRWLKTAHSVYARSDKEAQSKTRRKFQNAGFSSMSLVAVLDGIDPN